MNSRLIRKKQIDSMKGETRTHFLNENAVRICKSLGDSSGLNELGFHLIEIEPGRDSTEYHFHQFEDECVYILSGIATLVIDGEAALIEAGDFVAHPAGSAAHMMTNTGSSPLIYIVCGQRLAHDVVDYPNLNKRLVMNNDKNELIDIDKTDA